MSILPPFSLTGYRKDHPVNTPLLRDIKERALNTLWQAGLAGLTAVLAIGVGTDLDGAKKAAAAGISAAVGAALAVVKGYLASNAGQSTSASLLPDDPGPIGSGHGGPDSAV